MNKGLRTLATIMLTLPIIYGLMSFILMEVNPIAWGEPPRVLLVLLFLVASFITTLFYHIE